MMPKNVSTLLAPAEASTTAALAEHWRWLTGDALRPLGITTLGDWLLIDDAAAVYRLDTIEATLDRVAGSLAELGRRAASSEFRDELFLEGLAVEVLGGRPLARDTCVGFRVAPVLGGQFDASNLHVVPVASYQVWTARLHEALRKVPEGRQVVGVDVDDNGAISVRWK